VDSNHVPRRPCQRVYPEASLVVYCVCFYSVPSSLTVLDYGSVESKRCLQPQQHGFNIEVCVECLIGKQRNQFSLRSPSRVPYRTELIPRAPKGRRVVITYFYFPSPKTILNCLSFLFWSFLGQERAVWNGIQYSVFSNSCPSPR